MYPVYQFIFTIVVDMDTNMSVTAQEENSKGVFLCNMTVQGYVYQIHAGESTKCE